MTLIGVLGAIGTVVVWLVLGALVLAGAAATVPFDAQYDSARSSETFRISWLWGALLIYPRSRSGRRRESKETKAARKEKRKKRSAAGANRGRRRAMLDLARDPGFRRGLLRDLGRLIRRIEIPLVDLRIVLGLADPADTGVVYGLFSAAGAAVGADPRNGVGTDESHRIGILPDFDKETLSLTGQAHLRVLPIAVVGTALRIAVGPTGRRLLGSLWRTRRR